MEFIVLDPNAATEDQLKAAIDCNYRTYRLMSSQIETLKKANAQAVKKGKIKESSTPPEPELSEPETIDAEFEAEVKFFTTEVKKLSFEKIKESIKSVLPSRKHYDYERILKRIIAELYKEQKEIQEYILTEILDSEELAELRADQANYIETIKLILSELTSPVQETTIVSDVENELIFVPTSGGNIRVLDELDHIPSNYYKKFEALFSSIKDGTFKGVKQMQGLLDGLTEVRDIPSGARVTFMRLSETAYAVISAFIKKSDNSSGYHKMVDSHYQSYKQQEASLKANLTNPEFLTLHKQYELELFRKLNPNEDSKAPVYKKEVQ